MKNPALKHKINLDRPHLSNSRTVPSELPQIPFALTKVERVLQRLELYIPGKICTRKICQHDS